MSNVNMDGLPAEMQERIASIISGAQQKAMQQAQGAAPAAQAPPAPVPSQALAPKPPNLMDHVIALRQEVDAMRQQVGAMGQVVDAVGQAVGQLYAMFQTQTEPTNQSGYYQTQDEVNEDY